MDLFRAYATQGPDGPVVVLSGEADMAGAAELARVLAGCLAGDPDCLTIDATDLTFADSSGLQELVRAAREIRTRGGEAVLLRPCRAVARVLAITGADKMFIVLNEDEAEAEASQPAAPRRDVNPPARALWRPWRWHRGRSGSSRAARSSSP